MAEEKMRHESTFAGNGTEIVQTQHAFAYDFLMIERLKAFNERREESK